MLTSQDILNRHSVRTFTTEQVDKTTLNEIVAYANAIENPYHIPVTFKLLDTLRNQLSSPVILHADHYVAAKVKKQPHAEEAFGYAFEKFILKATQKGLGTVWLAATIAREGFEKAIALKEDEVMPTVSPIGYEAKKRSIREEMMRKGMKSDHRVEFEKLFYQHDFDHALKKEKAGKWLIPLQMVQKAPSATNKQPWRLVIEDNCVHFFEKKTKGYAKEETGDIQKVDLGIAMCHFEIGANEKGIKGHFVNKPLSLSLPENTDYIITYQLED